MCCVTMKNHGWSFVAPSGLHHHAAQEKDKSDTVEKNAKIQKDAENLVPLVGFYENSGFH